MTEYKPWEGKHFKETVCYLKQDNPDDYFDASDRMAQEFACDVIVKALKKDWEKQGKDG